MKTSKRTASPARPDAEARRLVSKREAATDAILVERMKSGDQSAFTEIVGRYREKLFSIAFGLLRDRHDAEEIVQDAFIRALRGIDRFRGDCSLATWLHRITVNLARNRYWYFHRRARHATWSFDRPITEESDATFGDVFPSTEASPARQASAAEFVELISVCMESLQPSHREILTMRNLLNHSYAEIAQALSLEEGTVKSRIARARGCLLTLMAEKCPEFSENTAASEWLELNDSQPVRHARTV